MTIDDERWNNIDYVRELLWDIIEKRHTPGEIRKRALARMRHYPEAWWVEQQRVKVQNPTNPPPTPSADTPLG